MTEPKPKNPRGRPRKLDHKTVTADATIGRTIWQLAHWGFVLGRVGEDAVLAVVADQAAKVLGRADTRGRALSIERIEQIYEAWLATAPSGWKTAPIGLRNPSGISIQWRQNTRPHGKSLIELTNDLLVNGGQTTFVTPGTFAPLGDPVLTQGKFDIYEKTRLRFSGDRPKN